jgi:hypothetical protein
MDPHNASHLLVADSIFTTNLSRTFHFPHLSTYINHPQDYPSALLLQIRPITNLGGK